MPTKDTIEIDVNVADGGKSLKSLKSDFASIQTELDGLTPGTQKYIDTLKRLGAVKDQIGDLRAEIAAFAGTDAKVAAFGNVISGVASGFQAAQGAAALFGSQSEDLQKTLLKVQAAASLAQGIQGFTAMGDSLKVAGNVAKNLITQIVGVETVTKTAAIAQRVWNAVMAANPIGLLIAGLAAAAGAIYALTKAFEDNATAADKAVEAAGRLKAQNDELIKGIDNQITALSGLKSNEEEIIKLEEQRFELAIQAAKAQFAASAQKAKEQENDLSFNQEIISGILEVGGIQDARAAVQKSNSAETRKAAKEQYDELKKLEADYSAFHNRQKQKEIDDDKNAYEKRKKQLEELGELRFQAYKKQQEQDNQEQAASDYLGQLEVENEKKKQAAIAETNRIQIELNQAAADSKKKADDEAAAEKQKSDEAELQAQENAINSISSLSQGYYALRLRAAKGSAVEEQKIRKQQFAVDKAFNIARAIQDGIRSVQAALTIPPPGGQILAAVNAGIAAGNVAKIAATEFNTGGGGSIEAPALNTATGTFVQNSGTVTQSNNTTQLNQDGSVANGQKVAVPIKAYVVESEAAATTKRLNKLDNQSKIG